MNPNNKQIFVTLEYCLNEPIIVGQQYSTMLAQ